MHHSQGWLFRHKNLYSTHLWRLLKNSSLFTKSSWGQILRVHIVKMHTTDQLCWIANFTVWLIFSRRKQFFLKNCEISEIYCADKDYHVNNFHMLFKTNQTFRSVLMNFHFQLVFEILAKICNNKGIFFVYSRYLWNKEPAC